MEAEDPGTLHPLSNQASINISKGTLKHMSPYRDYGAASPQQLSIPNLASVDFNNKSLEHISPYKNLPPKDRVLPQLKSYRQSFNYSIHEKYIEKVSEELDFRKLVKSIFDKSSDNPYTMAVEMKKQTFQKRKSSDRSNLGDIDSVTPD